MKRTNSKIRYLCEAALISALYVMLTYISAMLGLSSGPIQLRLSEALCIIAVFTPAAIPGVTVGCFAANLLTFCAPWDIVFGTLASFCGVVGCRALRKLPYLAPAPYAMANIIAVPLIQAYVYSMEQALPLLFLFAAAGELIAVYALGIPLYEVLKKNRQYLFEHKNRPR